MLEELVSVFGCGHVRSKGVSSSVMVFVVEANADLRGKVIPFFERYPLIVKRSDLDRFAAILEGLARKEHFTSTGFERLVRLAYGMNVNGKQRTRRIEEILGSSETVRRACASPPAQ